MNRNKSPWFVTERFNPSAKVRLFCFPYAGGSSNAYRGWQDKFGEEVEVVAVELPGRGKRFNDPVITSLTEIVSQLRKEMEYFLDKPFIFFGHSNGALISYELARTLQKDSVFGLQHIIVSAKEAPQLVCRNTTLLCDLPDDELIEELRTFDGTPEVFFQNKELMELYIPMLRADFSIGETYDFKSDVPLRSNVTLFGGKLDKNTSVADIMKWGENVIGSIQYQDFNGGHFFIHTCKDKVIDSIKKIVVNINH